MQNRLLLLLALICFLPRCLPAASVSLTGGVNEHAATSCMVVHVSEQCYLTVPAIIGFQIADSRVDTTSTPVFIALNGIVLARATQQVKLYLKAMTESFVTPVPDAPTWRATDIHWSTGVWQHGAGQEGTLSAASFSQLVRSDAGATSLTTDGFVFTLHANPSVIQAGDHSLQLVWKIESMTQ